MVVVIVVGIGGLSVVGWVVATAASAPELSSLKARDPGSNTEVLAADGTRLGFISADDLSRPVSGAQLPKVLRDATVAIEDERFYRHKGVDYESIVRAAVENFASRETVQGGSTLTMQLVKNLYTADRARSGLAGYKRKIREAKLAEELENEHDKEWILERYLNTVPYGTVGGQTAIGAEAAARIYFNKRAKKLKLHEAALLAGLPQAPSLYSPITNGPAAKRRRNQVLAKMAELGMITAEQARKATRRGLNLNPSDYFSRRRESYFFDYVKDELIKEYGPQTVKLGGLVVHTTINLKMQEKARAAISSQMGDIGPSSALVTLNPRNGYILAMASSGDYADSKFNLAAQGERQPGSSFKTMALMTALRNGVNPSSTRYTSVSPTRINDPKYGPPFEIKTYGGTSGGNMNLVEATVRSDNSVFIQLALDLGPDKVADTAVDMGIRREHVKGYPAESLGGLEEGVSPLEMATAYATIASGGYRNRPTAITKVEFAGRPKVKLPRRWRVKRTKVFEDGMTYEATKILQQNIQRGTGTRAATGCPAAGKTGTTDLNTDAWFAGFTPRLSTAVWVGYPNDRTQMNGLFYGGNVDGGTFPAAIWGAYMKSVIGGFCGDFPPPKVPFSSSPFFGEYSTTGGGKLGYGNGESDTTPEPATPAPETPAPPSTGDPSGGTEFDPEQYESPPQEAPETGDGE
ncbi:MAG TPA: transglycosylase domain-containing protein [Solirubrobacteraceae bacterium]|nr:transglycosylase domain-containing protein [Solirubrobacteraceae bacterium]